MQRRAGKQLYSTYFSPVHQYRGYDMIFYTKGRVMRLVDHQHWIPLDYDDYDEDDPWGEEQVYCKYASVIRISAGLTNNANLFILACITTYLIQLATGSARSNIWPLITTSLSAVPARGVEPVWRLPDAALQCITLTCLLVNRWLPAWLWTNLDWPDYMIPFKAKSEQQATQLPVFVSLRHPPTLQLPFTCGYWKEK